MFYKKLFITKQNYHVFNYRTDTLKFVLNIKIIIKEMLLKIIKLRIIIKFKYFKYLI